MAEDALTFKELQTHVSSQLGVSYYGAAGDEVAQPPTDTYTLAAVKEYVNGGLRMFLNDAPPEGWRFQQPTASVVLWASITVDTDVTVTGSDYVTSTTITATGGTPFYPSMVGHTISFTTTGDFVVDSYTSSTVISVIGDASAVSSETFSMTADGNYTLPSTFGGEYLGPISYAAGENPGASLRWGSEGEIRRLRENVSSQTGYPTLAAVRKMDATNVARLWELVVYPTPGGDYTVEFPYELYFTALSADGDLHPAGIHYDETVMAACEAYAEMKGNDNLAGRVQYYEQKALPAAQRRNQRSAPRRLGSLLVRRPPFSDWRDSYARPDVTTP